MPVPTFQPRKDTTASELFERILERIHHDLPDAVGLAVSVHEKHGGYAVVASAGVGREFVEAQLCEQACGPGGPVPDAFEHQVPVLSPRLWEDDRWPALTARYGADWPQIRGAVAVPGIWQSDSTVVLSCVLSAAAGAATIITLIGYEQLVTAAMVTSMVTTQPQDGTPVEDMMAVLQSRGAIEQAKGAIMGLLRCDADTAWATLRRASHESNVKLRVLAVALVEHISGAPAEQPAVGAAIVPDDSARKAAQMLWAVLTHAAESAPN